MRFPTLLLTTALLICGGFHWGVGAEEPAFVITANQLALPVPIGFATDAATITEASAPALTHIAAFLAAKPGITMLRIEVHSDDLGEAAAALALTRSRALAVVAALVARGVARERLIAVGFGGSKPLVDPATAEGRTMNRRVVAQVAALRGHALGGMPLDGGGSVASEVPAP